MFTDTQRCETREGGGNALGETILLSKHRRSLERVAEQVADKHDILKWNLKEAIYRALFGAHGWNRYELTLVLL